MREERSCFHVDFVLESVAHIVIREPLKYFRKQVTAATFAAASVEPIGVEVRMFWDAHRGLCVQNVRERWSALFVLQSGYNTDDDVIKNVLRHAHS